MERELRVTTPESIAFSYELAGLGSRFLAVAIDMAVQFLVLFGLLFGLAFAATHGTGIGVSSSRAATTLISSWAIAALSFILFAIFFGYFILFEGFWNGQTPGKKALGLRVVRDGGYAADLTSVTIRNLIRIGELLPWAYSISAIAALLSAENKRLGDMAAGTIVVRDARSEPPIASSPEAGVYFSMLSADERALIDRFAARRGSLAPVTRALMAARIAAHVRPRLSRDLQLLGDEQLLERLSAS